MSIEAICELPVAGLAANDSALLMWVTYPVLADAFKIIETWGFTYKTVAFTWAKTCKKSDGWHMGMGHYTRANAEICLLAIKGRPKRISKSVRQLIVSPVEEHSKKPGEVRERIVELFGDVPRIELFARQKVHGWDCFGNEVDSDIVLSDGRTVLFWVHPRTVQRFSPSPRQVSYCVPQWAKL
jgi:N6-adenosine-specific RNA methylase IME4